MHNPRRVVILSVVGMGCTLLLCARQPVNSQEISRRLADFRQSMLLDVDGAAVKKLRTAEEHIQVQQWTEAVDLLRQIVEAHGEKLVAVAPNRYVNVRTYAHMLVASLPPAGLQVYRDRIDPIVKKGFEAGKSERDEELLLKVIRLGFCSSYGDEALLLLGDIAYEQGALSRARSWWEKILTPRTTIRPGEALSSLSYPDTDLDQAAVRARLVLCSFFQGNRLRGERELLGFDVMHPQAKGILAGRTGNFSKLLHEIAADAANSPPPAGVAAAATFAGNYQRNSVQPHALEIGSEQWSAPLKDFRAQHGLRPAVPLPGGLSYFPVIYEDAVLVNDDESIQAYTLRTGRPRWKGDGAENSQIYPSVTNDLDEVPFRAFRDELARDTWIPRFTMTVADGRLFARMGPPGTIAAPLRGQASSRLICLDLARGEGKLLWETKASQLEFDGGRWSFEGSPVVAGGELFVGLRRQNPQPQSNVACFDAETGKLRWNRKVCVAAGAISEEHRESSHQLLTFAENTLYYSTNLGTVAALDPRDGTVRWIATYDRQEQEELQIAPIGRDKGLTPCLFHEDTVYAAPGDCNRLFAFDAETGILKWEREFRRPVQALLGVAQGKLFVSNDGLWALDIERKGRIAWTFGKDDPAEFGYGRGVLAEDVVYWSTHDDLFLIEQKSGLPRQRIQQKQTAGNLTIADGFLIVAQPTKLVAFWEFSGQKKQLEQEVTAHPQSARPCLELALVEEALQEWKPALVHFRQAAALATPTELWHDHLLREVALERCVRLLIQSGDSVTVLQKHSEASEFYAEAAQLAGDPSSRCTALLRLAATEAGQDHSAAALAAYQSILKDPDLRELRVTQANHSSTSVPRFAVREITGLIARHGQKIYQPFESAAAAACQTALKNQDPAALQTAIEQFPAAQIVTKMRLRLAELYRARAGPHRATLALQQGLEQAIAPEQRRVALTALAQDLEQRELWRAAASCWLQLAGEFAEQPINIAGQIDPPAQPGKIREFVAARLELPQYREQRMLLGIDPPEFPWSRRWQCALPAGVRPLVPHGTPPSVATACVLVDHQGLNCLNSSDGKVRWTLSLTSPLKWAGYVADHLVLGTSQELRAIAIETGKTLWERRLKSQSDSSENRLNRQQSGPAPTAIHHETTKSDIPGEVFSQPDLVALSATDQFHSFELIENRVLVLRSSQVWAFDGEDGSVLWSYLAPAGILQSRWLCTPEAIVLQALQPDRQIVLSSQDGAILGEHPGSDAPWQHNPVRLLNTGFAFITGRDDIRAGTLDGRLSWKYAGPFSRANARPDLLTNGSDLVLVIDGDTLVKTDIANGHLQWTRGLGSEPIRNAHEVACVDQGQVYLASGGVLRCFSLDQGELKWESYLSQPKIQWRVAKVGNYLAVFPIASPDTVKFSLIVCEAGTGEFVQRLHFEGLANDSVVLPGVQTTLVATGSQLYGLGTR